MSIAGPRGMRALVCAAICAAAGWALVWVSMTHLVTPLGAGTSVRTAAPTAGPGLRAVQSLPLAAQSLISGTLGASDARFDARRSPGGWQLHGGGVRAEFGAGPVGLHAAAGTVSMSLAHASGRWTARGNRVTRSLGPVHEWYAAGPLGIEQGFTVARRPRGGGSGRLTLVLRVAGSLVARPGRSELRFASHEGRVGLLYGGLEARDADGHRLAATLTLRAGRLVIGVNDRGARYPITIDPLVQQGGKLTPSGESGPGSFGVSVALSSDGNTALVGGNSDDGDDGAAWVFTRSGGTWTQQGPKLTGGGATAGAGFGSGVALSADGNTALIGGNFDGATNAGAAWVFTRSGGTWTQQGSKLTGAGATAGAAFGSSVALSADGNTALVGGPTDGPGNAGAAWAFGRGGSTWSPLGSTLVGAGESGPGQFGSSVALSADGITALVGGNSDTGGKGAAWAFLLSGGSFTQQAKLTGGGEAGNGGFGQSVALSADGNTALIGAPNDGINADLGEGAAWVFTRALSIWSQQGQKLTGSDAGMNSGFGSGVALSSDGNVALMGGQGDGGGDGAAWTFARSGTTWAQQGAKLTGLGENLVGAVGHSVALAADAQTALIGGNADAGGAGAAWAFAPVAPSCANASVATPAGGGAATVSLPCTGPDGALLSYAIVSGPAHGSLGAIGAGGQVAYSSQGGYVGGDAFSYRVTDQWGVSNTGTATITVPAFAAPVCANVGARGRKGATKVTLTLSCRGPVGVAISYAIVTPPGNGKLGRIDRAHGTVTYTTHVGFSGTDRFTYRATDIGGASATATATIILPALERITSVMTWPEDFGAGATSTVIPDLLIKNLPGGAQVKLSCSKGCPIKSKTLALDKQRVCKGKGKKRKCKLVVPKSGNLDLGRYLFHRHVKVGGHITVAMIQSGSIGKEYVFGMVKNDQPSVKIQTLAPGSTAPCPGC